MAINIGSATLAVNASAALRAVVHCRSYRRTRQAAPGVATIPNYLYMTKARSTQATIPDPRQQRIPSAENLFKIVLFIGLMLGSFAVTTAAVRALEGAPLGGGLITAGKWSLVSLMAIWNGMLMLALAVLAHDAVHRALFRSPFWNEFWGGMLSALALIPFYINRQIHLTHHSYAHQPGLDPENELHHRPFWAACTIGSLAGVKIHYQIFFHNLRYLGDRRYTGRLIKDALFILLAGGFYFMLVPALGMPLGQTVVPMILAFPLVFAWRAVSDHYGIPAIERATFKGPVLEVDADAWHRDRAKRGREVTGWVVRTSPWLEWLWSHVNYHEVHHKYPWLSHRHLPQAYAATRASQPYLVVDGYWRSFFNLSHRDYYESRENARPYLTTPDW